MKKVRNDPLRGQPGTAQFEWRFVHPSGMTEDVTTRARFREFVNELGDATPEVHPERSPA